MKHLVIIYFLLTIPCSLLQAQPVESVIKSQAIEMGKAMVAGDTRTFTKFMLPELVQAGGGGEKVLQMMDTAMTIFKQFGGQVTRITYGHPAKPVKFNKELQTHLSQTTELTSIVADIVFTSTIVAISRDNGKNWYFYDMNIAQSRDIKGKLPELSPEIKLPPPPKPRITPKQEIPK